MKKTKENIDSENTELLPEYIIDYSKVKRNPYHKANKTFVEIDNDIINIFNSPDEINNILRTITNSLTKKSLVNTL